MFDAIFSLDEKNSLKVFFCKKIISLTINRDHLSPKISIAQLIGHFDLNFKLFDIEINLRKFQLNYQVFII
jgi:hypothetical protein